MLGFPLQRFVQTVYAHVRRPVPSETLKLFARSSAHGIALPS